MWHFKISPPWDSNEDYISKCVIRRQLGPRQYPFSLSPRHRQTPRYLEAADCCRPALSHQDVGPDLHLHDASVFCLLPGHRSTLSLLVTLIGAGLLVAGGEESRGLEVWFTGLLVLLLLIFLLLLLLSLLLQLLLLLLLLIFRLLLVSLLLLLLPLVGVASWTLLRPT